MDGHVGTPLYQERANSRDSKSDIQLSGVIILPPGEVCS